ncbi:hypothetical protein [Novosphingobium sp. 32-60-15]|uniref:hypothetical protein n=1 Tax=Novosphingobium sp. 32-60-15 TaxID=1970410 RepID=UPI0025E4FEC2|nr:hypothetical protein [Novosphingobium sp. 32-60-15]
MRRDDRDRGLGREQLAGGRAEPDQGLALTGLIFGPEENLGEKRLERAVPANRRADHVRLVGLGLKVMPAHCVVLRILCCTCRAAPSALLIALPAAEAAWGAPA